MSDNSNCSARSGRGKKNKDASILFFWSMSRKNWICWWHKRKTWIGGTRNTFIRSRITRRSSIGYCLSCCRLRKNWRRPNCNTRKCWKRISNDLYRFWTHRNDSIVYKNPSYFISCQIRRTIHHPFFTLRIPANTRGTRKVWYPSSKPRLTKDLWLWKWAKTGKFNMRSMSTKVLCT